MLFCLVRNEKDGHRSGVAVLLHHLRHVYSALGENRSYLCKHAGAVVCLKADIVRAFEIFDKLCVGRFLFGIDKSRIAVIGVGCAINYVADYCAARGKRARAPAVQHNVLHAVARDIYGVVAVVYACKGVLLRDKRGVNAHLYAVSSVFTDSKQFYCVAELFAVVYILNRNARYSLAVNFGVRNLCMKGETGKNGKFVSCVVSLHVRFGIGFGIAKLLRFL